MKNKFIKTLCSFQIGVNIIGLPIYLEFKSKELGVSKFIKQPKIKILCDTYVY